MIDYYKVLNGIVEYVDYELTPKLNGVPRILFGTGVGIALKKADKVFSELKNNQIMKTLEIIKDNNININLLYEELIKQMEKSPLTIGLPYIGELKFNRNDLDTIYQYITKEE